ncbi:MAG: xanthine dehydrogenase family protein subunit M [Gammaproteobacteria bacterium]
MAEIQYAAPETVAAAVKALAAGKGRAKVLAGGTDLLVQLRAGRISPDVIVDIKKIPELRKVKKDKGGYRVGAAVSGQELGENADFRADWPGVLEGFELIGSTQVQGRASLGGNLCNGSPAADGVPGLIAAGATVTIAGPKGEREENVEDIVTGPGQTSLKPGEFVVTINLPKRGKRGGDAYLRFIPRTEMDIAVVGAAVSLTLDAKGVCTDARVSLGAVAPRPLLVKAAGKALVGTKIDDAALDALAAAASAACSPIDDKRGTIEFRTKVAGVLARRAALIALERARNNA